MDNKETKKEIANINTQKNNIPVEKSQNSKESNVKQVTNNTTLPENIKSSVSNQTQEVTTPIFDAQKMESNETVEIPKPANPTLNQADFSTIFHVSSEETPTQETKSNESATSNKKTNQNVINNSNTNNQNNTNNTESTKQVTTNSQFKKQVFNSEERLLYEIKPDKEGNPIVVILFFIFLFGSIIALPYVSKKIDFNVGNTPNQTQPPISETEEEFYYFNKSSVRAKIGGLEFTNFVKSKKEKEYFLTFNITNTNDRAYQYDKKYYVVFYDGEAIAYRALVHSYDAIGSNAAQEITIPITERGYSKADRFKIEEIPSSRYPDTKLIEKDGDYEILTCRYNSDEIKYYFIENKLAKLKETYTETLESNKDYEKNKTTYEKLSQSYKTINNFNSNFIVTNDYFTMINEFIYKDIADATLSNLKTYKFFRYNEDKNVVSFELEAQGYTCN